MIDLKYESRRAEDLTEAEIEACSKLYGDSYGKYDKDSPFKPGEQIKMSASQYRKRYCKDGVFLVRAMDMDRQVGHALYIRKSYEPYGIITWVLQLVVHKDYRRQGIASTLLRSIWGFSDDFAWGLASANPCTVKTLESATFRKCDTEFIVKNLDIIKIIGKDTTFVDDDAYVVDKNMSQVNTRFFADNSDYSYDRDCSRYLGELRPGHEWLAFTFREQPISRDSFNRHFSRMMKGYKEILKDAYSRMNLSEHPWTKGTDNEVEFLRQYCDSCSVLDMGCGSGRHSIVLAELGYSVTAVDNSERLIDKAKASSKNMQGLRFTVSDIRKYRDKAKYDMAICLFDVIGSYPNIPDNQRIMRTAYRNLKAGGLFILSVMNMELTENMIPDNRKGNMSRRLDILENLPSADIMQSTGQIFDPEYLAMDTERNLIYRKEKFENDNGLPAEYIIRDKRYRKQEIIAMLEGMGFEIMDARYVQRGHFDIPLDALDERAKEICVVCRKQIKSARNP